MSSNPFELGLIASYRKAVGGIVPGYSGHVPGARDKYAYSKWGEVPAFGGQARQGNVRPPMKVKMAGTTFSPESAKYGNTDTYNKETRQFKQEVNGVLPGYAGHIPAAREEVGAPATGSVPKEIVGAQFTVVNEGAAGGILGGKFVGTGRVDGMTSDLTVGTEMSRMRGIVPGYGGFIPASRDKYGATPYGGGPLTKVEK